MVEFRLDRDVDTSGTHNVGAIRIAPRRLVEVFGPPGEADRYKISGIYTFSDEGHVYTVYDWKETSLYTDAIEGAYDYSAVSPEEFWSNRQVTTLQIGGRTGCDVDAFKRWLLDVTS